MCNNCNCCDCGRNRFYDGGEFFNNCGCDRDNCCFDRNCGCNCGCNNHCGDAAFRQAVRVNNRILARRACEDRSAALYLRNLHRCNRCW